MYNETPYHNSQWLNHTKLHSELNCTFLGTSHTEKNRPDLTGGVQFYKGDGA